MSLRTLFLPSKPTIMQIAVTDLYEAEAHKLAASMQREYYCMAEEMYMARVQRLKQEIADMLDEARNACRDAAEAS